MTKKIVLTVMIIVALLIAVYKWIMSDDIENEEQKQKVEETETAKNEKEETVNGKAEEATEDKVENHK